MLICSSEEATETFIAPCDVAARDLLLPYGDVVMTLSIVLRIKRTLDGAEIDNIISDLQARKARGSLRDGRHVEIRALRHEDRTDLEDAVKRASAESLRRRFFSVRRHFSEREIECFHRKGCPKAGKRRYR